MARSSAVRSLTDTAPLFHLLFRKWKEMAIKARMYLFVCLLAFEESRTYLKEVLTFLY